MRLWSGGSWAGDLAAGPLQESLNSMSGPGVGTDDPAGAAAGIPRIPAPVRPPALAASHASNYRASLDHLRIEAHVGSPRSLPSADVFSPVSLLANVHRPRHRPDNRPLARRHTQRTPCELQWPSWSRISSSRPFFGKPAASQPGSPPMSPPLSRTPPCSAGERGQL
jgi:hypothetical protein